eukprot:GHVR01170580.1.p1 GENE.GHVR01170580.1~~GHVR01170580.1.p1  ORF type:complete len:180 (+),score=46.50 GHVR01170580.1:62-601(+)
MCVCVCYSIPAHTGSSDLFAAGVVTYNISVGKEFYDVEAFMKDTEKYELLKEYYSNKNLLLLDASITPDHVVRAICVAYMASILDNSTLLEKTLELVDTFNLHYLKKKLEGAKKEDDKEEVKEEYVDARNLINLMMRDGINEKKHQKGQHQSTSERTPKQLLINLFGYSEVDIQNSLED